MARMLFSGLILLAHGARDPRWAEPFERLRDKVVADVPAADVSLAFLELMTPDLPTAMNVLAAKGCRDVVIVPVFFGQGGHVRTDLPRLVETVTRDHPSIRIHCTDAIGENDAVLNALAAFCVRAVAQSY